MNGPRIAIDFGTTRTKVAHFDADRHEPRLIELGREIRAVIPSVFYLPREGEGDRLVGDDAVERVDVDPEGIVVGLKREIHKLGRKRCGPGRPTPSRIELAADLFTYIRHRCEQEVFHGQRVEACTLTVPVVFAEQQRECIRQAAELGGFRDIRLLDEPVAAAIAWLAGSGKRLSDAVVVCDVGGGTTDFALLRWIDGRFQAHPEVPAGGFALGGNDVDEAIWERALEKCGADETNLRGWSAAFLVKLRAIKEWLGRNQPLGCVSLQNRVLDVPDHVATECVHEFVARVQTELQKYLGRCRVDAGIEEPPVLLVGGASRLLGLKEAVEQLAPGRVFRWNESDYATVLGAVERLDASATNRQPNRSAATGAYREAVASAYADGLLTAVELDHLRERQRSLGLSDEDAASVERDVLGKTKEEAAEPEPTIVVQCPCGQRLRAPARHVGRTGKCTKCGQTVTIREEPAKEITPPIPPSYESAKARAEQALEAKQWDDALQESQIMRDLLASSAEAMLIAGRAYLGQGKLERALDAFSAAIAKDSALYGAFFWRGLSLLSAERWHDAIADFQHARGLKEAQVRAFEAFAHLKLREADRAHAHHHLNAALDVFSDAHDYADFADAVVWWLDQALQVDPDLDLLRLRDAPSFAPCRNDHRFRALVTPRLVFAEHHGAVFNDATITNSSQFTTTGIQLHVKYHWEKEGRHEQREFTVSVERLRPGESKTWENVFRDAPWFGVGISQVRHQVTCDQDP